MGKICIGIDENKADISCDVNSFCCQSLIAGGNELGYSAGITTSAQTLAEQLSDNGIPVIMTDTDGDLPGIALKGEGADAKGYPTLLWDVFGIKGLPFCINISDLGEVFLANVLCLSDRYVSTIKSLLIYAGELGLKIDDYDDLVALASFAKSNISYFRMEYGIDSERILDDVIFAIKGRGAALEPLLGSPNIDAEDLLSIDNSAKGIVSILDCKELNMSPRVYGVLVGYILKNLAAKTLDYKDGGMQCAVMVDQADLIFKDCSDRFLDEFVQIVRKVENKGIGIVWITKVPGNLPGAILDDCKNMILHSSQPFTKIEVKKVDFLAKYLRNDKKYKIAEEMTIMDQGDAFFSFTEKGGVIQCLRKGHVNLPKSSRKILSDDIRRQLIENCRLRRKYMKI